MEKGKLQQAYNAGVSSVKFNADRDRLLDEGTKQCPAEASFDNWYRNQEADKLTTVGRMAVFEQVISNYSTLKEDNGIFHAQLFEAMENYLEQITGY